LFGLLAMLIPLFAGLQYLVYESVPRVEIRVITTDPPAAESIPVPAERVVERIVFVPVETTIEAVPLNEAGAGLPPAPVRDIKSPGTARLGGLDSARAAPVDAAPEQPAIEPAEVEPDGAADPGAGLTQHMGLVALATAAPAPVVAVRPPVVAAAPAVRYVPAPVEEPEDEAAADDAVADEVTPDEPVADGPETADDGDAVAQVQFIETTIDADQSTRVVMYRVPVRPEAASDPVEPESVAPAPDDEPVLADAPDEAAPEDSDAEDAEEIQPADDRADEAAPDAEADEQPGVEAPVLAARPDELELDVVTGQ
jgi:hypothetical protein